MSEEQADDKVKKSKKDEIEAKVHQHKHIQKDQWGSDIEFLLSCITLSVGLGNVWRFIFILVNLW